jgi:hypothetical protein
LFPPAVTVVTVELAGPVATVEPPPVLNWLVLLPELAFEPTTLVAVVELTWVAELTVVLVRLTPLYENGPFPEIVTVELSGRQPQGPEVAVLDPPTTPMLTPEVAGPETTADDPPVLNWLVFPPEFALELTTFVAEVLLD